MTTTIDTYAGDSPAKKVVRREYIDAQCALRETRRLTRLAGGHDQKLIVLASRDLGDARVTHALEAKRSKRPTHVVAYERNARAFAMAAPQAASIGARVVCDDAANATDFDDAVLDFCGAVSPQNMATTKAVWERLPQLGTLVVAFSYGREPSRAGLTGINNWRERVTDADAYASATLDEPVRVRAECVAWNLCSMTRASALPALIHAWRYVGHRSPMLVMLFQKWEVPMMSEQPILKFATESSSNNRTARALIREALMLGLSEAAEFCLPASSSAARKAVETRNRDAPFKAYGRRLRETHDAIMSSLQSIAALDREGPPSDEHLQRVSAHFAMATRLDEELALAKRSMDAVVAENTREHKRRLVSASAALGMGAAFAHGSLRRTLRDLPAWGAELRGELRLARFDN